MFFYFILIFLFFCTANSSKIGKCDTLVADFALDLEYDNASENTILKCRKVLNCFGSLNTTDGDKLKRSYEFRCEKYEFYKIGGTRCFDHFLNDQIWKKDILPNENLDLRSNLLSAKSSILDLATIKCSKTFQSYLTANYTQFVDYWTVSPGNGSCESLHAELENKEFLFLADMIVRNWKVYTNGVLRISVEPKDRLFAKQSCQRFIALKSCPSYTRQEAIVACESIDVITSDFYNCAKNFVKNRNQLYFRKCHVSDKKCVKEEMKEECGEITNFDKYYNWFDKNYWRQPQVIGVGGHFLRNAIYIKSPIRKNSALGACAGLVDEAVSVLSRNKGVKAENFWIAQKTSGEAMKCYKIIRSEESESLQKSFQLIWNKSTFSYHNMYKCVDKFLRSQRVRENSPFLSSNFTIRRKTFTFKKMYLRIFAHRHCSKLAKDYLNMHYNRFVNLMTSKPKNDRCNSVSSTIETQQCTQFVKKRSRSYPNFKYQRNSFIAGVILKECASFEQCMNTCPTPHTPKLKKWCDASKEGSIYFYACLEKIRQEEHLLPTDHCGRTGVKKTKYDDGYVFQFNNKKECLKELMKEKCYEKALENFDDHFERSQADYTLNE
ncbi:unnamed protein product [Caenorhabditis brenneri]